MYESRCVYTHLLHTLAGLEIKAIIDAPNMLSNRRFDPRAAGVYNTDPSVQKYKTTRIYVVKPGWYSTII